jgi:hypothetical protein
MNFDRKLLLQLAAPFAAMLIPLGLWYFSNLKPTLTKQEKTLMMLALKPVTISRPEAITVSGIECPVKAAATSSAAIPKSYPPVPLDAIAPRGEVSVIKKTSRPGPVFYLSLILVDDTKKMAIINGRVLREGEKIGTYSLVRIEKDKVKLKGSKGELWVNVE